MITLDRLKVTGNNLKALWAEHTKGMAYTGIVMVLASKGIDVPAGQSVIEQGWTLLTENVFVAATGLLAAGQGVYMHFSDAYKEFRQKRGGQ